MEQKYPRPEPTGVYQTSHPQTATASVSTIHRRVVTRGSRMAPFWKVSLLDHPFQFPASSRARLSAPTMIQPLPKKGFTSVS